MKRIVTGVISILLLIGLSGCQSRGSLQAPLKPLTAYENNGKETATVYTYRSSDHFGLLAIGFQPVVIDEKIEDFDDDGIELVMGAHRTGYTIKEFKPGIHSFAYGSLGRQGKQTVQLEKGKNYYLSITFAIFGTPGLQFKTKEDFLKETAEDNQIEIIGKWNAMTGYDYKIVNK